MSQVSMAQTDLITERSQLGDGLMVPSVVSYVRDKPLGQQWSVSNALVSSEAALHNAWTQQEG